MNRNKKIGRVLGACAAGVLLAGVVSLTGKENVYATELTSIKDVTSFAGAASLLNFTLDEKECLAAAESAQGAMWGYTNLGICNVQENNLNVRQEPNTGAKLVGKMKKGAACEIIETTEDGWAFITSGEVEGYVSMEYLYTGADAKMRALELVKTVAIVQAESLKVRDEASLDGAVLTQVPLEAELDVVEVLDDWVKVDIDGNEAYVSAEYVKVEEKLDTAVTMSELLYGQGVSDLRVDIVEYAKQFLGNPYVYGGSSLTKGTDCSGFTMSVYKHFGITISRSSRSQAKDGTKITADQLQPGDLIFYADSSGTINHVTLYIGGGQVIHASNERTGIKISQYKYRTPVKYVSILQD